MWEQRTVLGFVLVFCFAVFLLDVSSVKAEPNVIWEQTYGGDGMDFCTSMIQTPDGELVLFGIGSSFGPASWVIKTDANGNVQWNKTIRGSGFVQTSDGGFAFASTNQYSFGEYIPVGLPDDFWSSVCLGKTDEQGNVQWSQSYDEENGYYEGSTLVQAADGGYALVGVSFSSLGDYNDLLLIKTDSNGTKEWSKLYGGPEPEKGPVLIQTPDGGFALASATYSYGEGSSDFWLIKTDATGNIEWNQTYGGTGFDVPSSLIQLDDESFVLAGRTGSFGEERDFWLIKTDNKGNVIWNQTYGTENREIFPTLIQTSDGGFALAGYTVTSDEQRSGGFWLVKTDNQGNELWSQTYLGEGQLVGYPSIIQTVDGGFALSGGKGSWETEDYDFWLIKTNEQGVPEFPTWTPLLIMLLVVVFVTVIYKRRLTKHQANKSCL